MSLIIERLLELFVNEKKTDNISRDPSSVNTVEGLGKQLIEDAKRALGTATTTAHVGHIADVIKKIGPDIQ